MSRSRTPEWTGVHPRIESYYYLEKAPRWAVTRRGAHVGFAELRCWGVPAAG